MPRSTGATAAASAFIANTDFGWFSHFQHRAEPPDEVDFWQPSPHGFKPIPPGASPSHAEQHAKGGQLLGYHGGQLLG